MHEILLDASADQTQRDIALDIRRNIIVQAPAGSGKTDLLTRRYLRLLATVDEPEHILAITFTRAATAEMRTRILRDLEAAAGLRPTSPEDSDRIALAREALAHAEQRGWDILNHPRRLTIETIDSLCLRIAHDRPLLARLGGHFQPIDEAEPLYALAARRTLERLGSHDDPPLDRALAQLLDLRDNRLADCESLLAEMLRVRDQWQEAFPLSQAMSDEDWERVRINLEVPFHRENRRVFEEAHRLLAAEPALVHELLALAQHAAENGNTKVALLAGIHEISDSMPAEHWTCVRDFLLTGDGAWRRRVNARDGFPPGNELTKRRMTALLAHLQSVPNLLPVLCAIGKLPPTTYTAAQWTTLRNVFTVLRRAIAELQVVFAERNQVDFTQLTLVALEVLLQQPERVAEITGNIHHLLIDEFQDTSRRQHQLVSALVRAWIDVSDLDEHRTVFLVGDPMQSIYMFRQADVELFTQVRDRGIHLLESPSADDIIRPHPVQLSVNFRSHAGLTDPLNKMFNAICAEDPPPGAAAVPFVEATSSSAAPPEPCFHIHPQIVDQHAPQSEFGAAQQREAEQVLSILERHLPAIDRARAAGTEYRVAVLVRARPHLAQLVPLLREKNIPFRAVEIEHLAERQELLDLLALTRALLHPMDRIAWLSVLRAPWCGLTLSDLHRLTGSDDPTTRDLSVLELIERNQLLLSSDGQLRLTRTVAILRRALDLRWRQSESPSFASWIERTWRTLGGPSTIDGAACENAQVFFSLLDAVTPDGLAPATSSFDADFNRLFAQPDPAVSERCGIQLMTIHKAKGLGFDVVLVPGLDRRSSADQNPLICALERANPWTPEQQEFLVAPIGLQGEDTDPLYRWVRKQRQIRFDEERKRLLYVACTRARRELHLFGTAVLKPSGVWPAHGDSLLATAWPSLRRSFASAQPLAVAPRLVPFPQPGILEEIAAVATESAPRPRPRRLVISDEPLPVEPNVTVTGSIALSQPEAPEFQRPEGSRQARLIGSAVHTLLQRLGPQLATLPVEQIRAHAASLLRISALSGDSLRIATDTVTNLLRACAADPVCRWILAPHPEAQSEASWTGFVPGDSASRLRALRADRIFRAGREPLSEGSECLWVIDYKTSHVASGALFLAAERQLYAPQLRAYARALRTLHGPATQLRLGLYYPASATLDYWDPDREQA